MRSRLAPAILVVAYGLLGLSWAVANPPFASPDEGAHFLRTVGIAGGAWVGASAPDRNPALTPTQRAWSGQAARAVTVPAGLSPGGFSPCMSGDPRRSAACLDDTPRNPRATTEVTSVGTYQPLPYLLPAAVVRSGESAAAADRLGRLATFALWWMLLGAAVWLLWDGGAASLLGLMLAVTPMVVFVGTSLTGSSLEVAAALAFAAALLRLAREPSAPPPAAWVVAGAAGAALALSRSPGPAWVLLVLGLCAAFAGRDALRAAWRAGRVPAAGAGAAAGVGIVLNRYWEARHGPDVETSPLPPLESWSAGRRQLTGVVDDLVGNFGYLDTPLGRGAVVAWGLLIAALVAAAIASGQRRRALVLIAAVVAIAPVYLFAAVTRFTGFGLQARHVLALAVVLPLVAGEAVRRRAPARAVGLVAAAAGAIQLLAWWTNARRYAVGSDGPWWFMPDAEWSPPAGWWPWLLLAVAGAAGIAASALVSARRR